MGTAVLILEKSCRTGAWLVRRPNPVFVASSKFADMNIPYCRSANCQIITPATDTYAVRAHKTPDRFRLKKRLPSSSFSGATPALQYSPKLTAKQPKIKPGQSSRHDATHQAPPRPAAPDKPTKTLI